MLNDPGQGWGGLAAPKGMPAPIVDETNATFVTVFNDPKFIEYLNSRSVVSVPASPAASTDFLRADRKAAEYPVRIANTPKSEYKPQ
jgi:tripartite-type tricarboxylate transporter receptor subunit TctC